MKIFKYWMSEKQKVMISGEAKDITCYGGSNISLEDAAVKAKEKMEKLKRKIGGDRSVFRDYEVEIREEILKVVDDKSIITRNRYGARVLNAENLMFLDIDKPKASFGGLFKKNDPQQDKAKIFEQIRKTAASPKYQGLGFRVYETFQGARVIVLGKEFSTKDRGTYEMMNEFNCDSLYVTICRKQACFRARLTPKPYRMKMQAYKVKYPSDGNDFEFQNWLSIYEQASHNFSVCNFVEQIGASQYAGEVVQLHDEITGVNVNQPLA